MPKSNNTMPGRDERFLTVRQLRDRWGGCSHMMIERRLRSDPKFPRAYKLCDQKRFFRISDVERYERSRVSS